MGLVDDHQATTLLRHIAWRDTSIVSTPKLESVHMYRFQTAASGSRNRTLETSRLPSENEGGKPINVSAVKERRICGLSLPLCSDTNTSAAT